MLNSLELTNELLETECEPFDFNNPPYHPIQLSNTLTLLREKFGGVGLAANQVGLNMRVVSIKGIDSCLFNPKIVFMDDKMVYGEEGCLSFPGMLVKVKRSEFIRVRYTDALGNTSIHTYTNLTARIIQHEIDHLNGILFYNRANKFHKDQALRKWKRNSKGKQ